MEVGGSGPQRPQPKMDAPKDSGGAYPPRPMDLVGRGSSPSVPDFIRIARGETVDTRSSATGEIGNKISDLREAGIIAPAVSEPSGPSRQVPEEIQAIRRGVADGSSIGGTPLSRAEIDRLMNDEPADAGWVDTVNPNPHPLMSQDEVYLASERMRSDMESASIQRQAEEQRRRGEILSNLGPVTDKAPIAVPQPKKGNILGGIVSGVKNRLGFGGGSTGAPVEAGAPVAVADAPVSIGGEAPVGERNMVQSLQDRIDTAGRRSIVDALPAPSSSVSGPEALASPVAEAPKAPFMDKIMSPEAQARAKDLWGKLSASKVGIIGKNWAQNLDPRGKDTAWRIGAAVGAVESVAVGWIPLGPANGLLKAGANLVAAQLVYAGARHWYAGTEARAAQAVAEVNEDYAHIGSKSARDMLASGDRKGAEAKATADEMKEKHEKANLRIRNFMLGVSAGATYTSATGIIMSAAGVSYEGMINQVVDKFTGAGGSQAVEAVAPTAPAMPSEVSALDQQLLEKQVLEKLFTDRPELAEIPAAVVGKNAEAIDKAVQKALEMHPADTAGLSAEAIEQIRMATQHRLEFIINDAMGQVASRRNLEDVLFLASSAEKIQKALETYIGGVVSDEAYDSSGLAVTAANELNNVQNAAASELVAQRAASELAKGLAEVDAQKAAETAIPTTESLPIEAPPLSGFGGESAVSSIPTNDSVPIQAPPLSGFGGGVGAVDSLPIQPPPLSAFGGEGAVSAVGRVSQEVIDKAIAQNPEIANIPASIVGQNIEQTNIAAREAISALGMDSSQLSAEAFEKVRSAVQHQLEDQANRSVARVAEQIVNGSANGAGVEAMIKAAMEQAPNMGHQELVDAAISAVAEQQAAHEALLNSIAEQVSQPDSVVTEVLINRGKTVGEILVKNGYELSWGAPDAEMLGAHVAANYSELNTMWGNVAAAGNLPEGVHFPIALEDLDSVIEKAKGGDAKALQQLKDALHWLPTDKNFKVLNKSAIGALLGALKK